MAFNNILHLYNLFIITVFTSNPIQLSMHNKYVMKM